MCKWYDLRASADEIQDLFDLDMPLTAGFDNEPRAKGDAPIVVCDDGLRRVITARWGFVPASARGGIAPVNARGESLGGKPFFAVAANSSRCLIPTTGFYEWRRTAQGREPVLIRLKGGRPFALGGIWSRTVGGSTTFAMLTTEPNAVVAPIHCRMPVVVPPDMFSAWLDPRVPFEAVTDALVPYEASQMEAAD